MIVGITGGIATGKSTVSAMLRELGYQVIDSDTIAKDVMNHNKQVLLKLKRHFPEAFDINKKVINRQLLAQIIFYNSKKRNLLNQIVHPIVKQEIYNQINLSTEKIIFVDVPLLYESNFEDLFDYIIVVYTDESIQVNRLVERDKIDIEYAKSKISSQMPIEEKKTQASFLIDNSKSISNTKKQLLEIIEIISKKG